jgi:alcohol dehydrogenase (cytochrome c)
VKTGDITWELRQDGPGAARGGTLATASGLVFYVDDADRFTAVDAENGAELWHFPTSVVSRASPMTYQFDGRQYVAIASGPNILVFGLVD